MELKGKLFVSLLVSLSVGMSAMAQEPFTVTGKVTDASGQPVIGAGVMETGKSNGTITSSDGTYRIELTSSDGELNFSSLGYKDLTVDVGGRAVIDAVLQEDTNYLDEVVVVGYGVQRKSDLTGAISSINAEETMKKMPVSQVSDLLQGRVAGLSVVSSSGAAGASPTMRVRGINSIKADGGPLVVIDGFTGKLILNPEPRTADTYRLKAEEAGRFYSNLRRESMLMPETADGFLVQLAGNLDTDSGLKELTQAGACGVGLFRTEYLFLNRRTSPTEEEQFEIYKKMLSATEGRPIVVRTLDAGGDKIVSHFDRTPEQNPFLGLRGIRLCLRERPDLLRTQLRALLRAGVFGNLKVMLPMVSCMAEVTEVRFLIAELQKELKREKKEFVSRLSVGAMIETPAAALQTDRLAEVVDFFSLGTNDLVQYTMAIDRSNERVAYLYQPSHPAILELIARTVRAARRHNIWVSVCGQMAADPVYTPLLVGLGVHELSMEANAIGAVRRVVRGLYLHEAEAAARAALNAGSAEEALAISRALLRKVAPQVAKLVAADRD